jgi:hypothetical protein
VALAVLTSILRAVGDPNAHGGIPLTVPTASGGPFSAHHCRFRTPVVAYVVCEALAIPTTSSSIDYIRSYRGTPDTLRASLQYIRDTANRILSALTPPG